MDFEPSGIVPDMNDHSFDQDKQEEDDTKDNEQDVVDGFFQAKRPCLMDLLLTGWDELAKVNVKEVRKHTIKHLQQK
jgi:hypothetical protein